MTYAEIHSGYQVRLCHNLIVVAEHRRTSLGDSLSSLEDTHHHKTLGVA
jgi:hypothetical protein